MKILTYYIIMYYLHCTNQFHCFYLNKDKSLSSLRTQFFSFKLIPFSSSKCPGLCGNIPGHSLGKNKVQTYLMVQSCQGFDENISTFISKFISSRRKKVQSFVQIEIKMSIKMSTDKLVDFFFTGSM